MTRRCTTHHMCDCTAERMRELEAKLNDLQARHDMLVADHQGARDLYESTIDRALAAECRLGECEERFQAGRDAWEMLEKSVADLNALPGAREMRDALTGIMLVAPDLSDTEWAKEAAARQCTGEGSNG